MDSESHSLINYIFSKRNEGYSALLFLPLMLIVREIYGMY